jgi:hypothetical protein
MKQEQTARIMRVESCKNLQPQEATGRAKRAQPMRKIFKGLGIDACHCGITDFYKKNETALRSALKDKLPFDTGWFQVKKEIQEGRIHRLVRNGPIKVEVAYSLDDPDDLIDSAMWEAFGRNQTCSSGADALIKLGIATHEDVCESLESLASEMAPQTSETDHCNLHWKTGFDGVCKALNALMDDCDTRLTASYDRLVQSCKRVIADHKLSVGAACTNCKHFSAGIPESRSHPADPADCGHPKYYALLSANRYFPFTRGCKHWESRK